MSFLLTRLTLPSEGGLKYHLPPFFLPFCNRMTVPMQIAEQVRLLLRDTLKLGDRARELQPETPLLGGIPELDSMAVVAVIVGVEERFGITVADDEISAMTFETFGSLCDFIQQKVS